MCLGFNVYYFTLCLSGFFSSSLSSQASPNMGTLDCLFVLLATCESASPKATALYVYNMSLFLVASLLNRWRRALTFLQAGQRAFQECWGSVQCWLTSISVTMRSDQLGQRALQEFCRSAQRLLISCSASMRSTMLGQRVLQECLLSAQPWLASISGAITSALSGEESFELRDAVKPVAFFLVFRHLALLAPCHLFSRQDTRKSDILYTYRVVAFGLALSL